MCILKMLERCFLAIISWKYLTKIKVHSIKIYAFYFN